MNEDKMRREIARSHRDAAAIAARRRARKRHQRYARLYPTIFAVCMVIIIFVHFLWHPY